jgi:hypothetical protein
VPVVTHLVSLTQAAGVEAHFSEFVRHARASHPEFAHGWLNAARDMHPYVADRVEGELAHVIYAKRRFGLPLPARPNALRTWHCRRELAQARTDVVVIWNRTTRARFALDAAGERRCIHWEHGAAWDAGRETERREYLARVPLAIANSNAAARVLKLLWDYRGDVRVCRNALRRASCRPGAGPQAPPEPARDRFGAPRACIRPKRRALVLHAVAKLRRSPTSSSTSRARGVSSRVSNRCRALGLAQGDVSRRGQRHARVL